MEPENTSRIGRPLSYERDWCLHQAMILFWRHGYAGTSVAMLTKTMEISPPVLYSAFGDKQQLFLEVIDHYLSTVLAAQKVLLETRSPRDAIERLLKLAASVYGNNPWGVNGCLLMTAAISTSEGDSYVQNELRKRRAAINIAIAKRIGKAVASHKLPANTDVLELASWFLLTLEGMSTTARDGMHKPTLLRMVDRSMLAWPE